MSCFKSATAELISGYPGYLLEVKVYVYAGFVPPTIEIGQPPYNPKNILPVIIRGTVPNSANLK
jgi:hypothetical protein